MPREGWTRPWAVASVPGKLKKAWTRVRGVLRGMTLPLGPRIPQAQPVPVRANNRRK